MLNVTFIRKNGRVLIETKKHCFVSKDSLVDAFAIVRGKSFLAGVGTAAAFIGMVSLVAESSKCLEK